MLINIKFDFTTSSSTAEKIQIKILDEIRILTFDSYCIALECARQVALSLSLSFRAICFGAHYTTQPCNMIPFDLQETTCEEHLTKTTILMTMLIVT